MGAPEEAVMTVDVGADVTEIAIRQHGDLVYSQSARVGATGTDESELVEAVLLAQRRAPRDLDAALGKSGIVLRSVVPLLGLDVLLRERTGLPVRIAR
jgi:actin-like ATPase involved in cell morphogenesis